MSKDEVRDRDLTHTYTHTGKITHTRSYDGAPHPDVTLKNTIRPKIPHHKRLYVDCPDPIVFIPVAVNTSVVRLYHDFIRLLFFHIHRDTSTLTRELFEESDQFRFLRDVSLSHRKESVGLILAKASTMRGSIPLTSPLGPSFHFFVLRSRHLLRECMMDTMEDILTLREYAEYVFSENMYCYTSYTHFTSIMRSHIHTYRY